VTAAGARTTANILVFAAGAAAAYVVVTTPPLRRLAVRGLRLWLGSSIPIFIVRELSRAWTESGETQRPHELRSRVAG
jgi:hypothetical protein